MSMPQNVIAIVFDFDDTLTDDSTTKLLEKQGVDTADFWQNQMKKRTDEGWDAPLAYLTWILDNVGEGKLFGKLTNAQLREFGATLEFYPGLAELFSDLQEIASQHSLTRPVVEFYIVSGGLEEVIRGSIAQKYFHGIWGCNFAEEGGCIRHVKNIVTFTEKTKALFAINKGITDQEIRKNPYKVNEAQPPEDRRVPFRNMIYLGDGLTDVPCFSLLDKMGGKAFAVFDPRKKDSPKKAWENLVAPKRVASAHSPKYGREEDLGAILRAAVGAICVDLDLRSQTSLRR
jgi:hypothetical protein